MPKALYKDGVLKPLEKMDVPEGKIVNLEIKPDFGQWRGALRNMKISSVDLQHKIKQIWTKIYVSS